MRGSEKLVGNHEWWAVELRQWADGGDRELTAAIDEVLERVEAEADCSDCIDDFCDDMDVVQVERLWGILELAGTSGAYAAIDALRATVLGRGM